MKDFGTGKKVDWGVTFSPKYATELGLDWREAYLAAVDELPITRLRLVVYWDRVEANKGQFDFSEVDWQLAEAQKRDIKVLLAIGYRVPRWPECHMPRWAADLSPQQFEERAGELYRQSVLHFRPYSHLIGWQVANEPFLTEFGECPEITSDQLRNYIKIVRENDDQQRPIIITESGELSLWTQSARLADVIGTSLYRTVWNKYFGYWHYPLPAAFYRWHADLIMRFFPVRHIFISELQAEPWPPGKSILDTSLNDQLHAFSVKDFQSNLIYAQKAGFTEIYTWGVEWWYWLKEQGRHEFWDTARQYMK